MTILLKAMRINLKKKNKKQMSNWRNKFRFRSYQYEYIDRNPHRSKKCMNNYKVDSNQSIFHKKALKKVIPNERNLLEMTKS